MSFLWHTACRLLQCHLKERFTIRPVLVQEQPICQVVLAVGCEEGSFAYFLPVSIDESDDFFGEKGAMFCVVKDRI